MEEIEVWVKRTKQNIEEIIEREHLLSEEIKKHDDDLFGYLTKSAAPFIKSIGINLPKIGKQGTKNDLYDVNYYPEKMVVLETVEVPDMFRPDNPEKKVTDKLCVLSEKGKFYEVMYSSDGFILDSFLRPIDPKAAIDIYGYGIMLMLFAIVHDYSKLEKNLVEDIEKVVKYIYMKNSSK